MKDDNTVSTSELLDLIEAEVSSPISSNNNINPLDAISNSIDGRVARHLNSNTSSSRFSSLSRGRIINKNNFRVRLTSSYDTSSSRISDDDGEEDDRLGDLDYLNNDNNNEIGMNHRTVKQKMPLNGGYGGMFDAGIGTLKKDEDTIRDNAYDGGRSPTYLLFGDDGSASSSNNGGEEGSTGVSSLGSAFSLASNFFSQRGSTSSRRGTNSHKRRERRGNSSISSSIRTPSELYASLPEFFVILSTHYLRLPFQFRYFVQLFSVIGVFILASLNYFIAIEDPTSLSMQSAQLGGFLEGGGASTNNIPRLRVNTPFQYLHPDLHANALLEKATAKLHESTRLGIESIKGGPFSYGWKSMPRQIFNDFASGLSDDRRTIEHANTANGEGLGDKVFPPKGTVAYVLPITTCYPPIPREPSAMAADTPAVNLYPYSPNHPKDEESFRDFAVMLRAMVHAHSYQNSASGSMYDYKMHAMIHPSAKKCRPKDSTGAVVDRTVLLQNLGYTVSIERAPVQTSNIEGSEYLKKYLLHHGGDDPNFLLADMIRLNAYELDQYDAVVLVDYDTMILGPVDEAIDLITDNSNADVRGRGSSIDVVFSWKHVPSLVNPQSRASVINLSFFLLRPSKAKYAKLRRAYKSDPFSEGRGWGSIGRGRFPGWMTTQGFLTYYYDEVENAAKVEINRCAFGNTGEEDGGASLITNGGKVECGTPNNLGTDSTQCSDCSKSKFDDIVVADWSYCLAPWKCGVSGAMTSSSADKLSSRLCLRFQKEWFGGRLQMEDVHPQLQKGSGNICIDGLYQPMKEADHY